jgi:hypothetical protein
MKWIRGFELFLEAQSQFKVQAQNDLEKTIYKPTNLITEICVAMVLLNNEFLDNLLDRGLKSRYTESSDVFLTDLKNLLIAKNRLQLGRFEGDTCVEDTEHSKINGYFDEVKFDIEKDWNKLVDARITARNIMDKILVDEKLSEDLISKIYWIGPNKDKEHAEDLVIELNSGGQFSLFVNKTLSTSKSSSFNTFADDFIGKGIEKLYDEENIEKWNKLIQNWVKIIYENANKPIQIHIEKFIEPERIDTLGYFEYYDLKHRDMRFKNIGEHIKEFDKNILKFSDLMSEIWKNKEVCFLDVEKVFNEWMEVKIFLLNSKILEHLFTESLIANNADEVKKLDDGFKQADGTVKMKLIKTFVEKLGCLERPTYFLGKKGNDFHHVPSRKFFREFYNDLNIKFDYHVKLIVNQEDEEKNDFSIKLKLELDNQPLVNCNIDVKFSGGEMSGKLSAKYNFEPVDNFNVIISEKMKSSQGEKDQEIQ